MHLPILALERYRIFYQSATKSINKEHFFAVFEVLAVQLFAAPFAQGRAIFGTVVHAPGHTR
jgi:hypothetical protein